jgi:hypothetical protein
MASGLSRRLTFVELIAIKLGLKLRFTVGFKKPETRAYQGKVRGQVRVRVKASMIFYQGWREG